MYTSLHSNLLSYSKHIQDNVTALKVNVFIVRFNEVLISTLLVIDAIQQAQSYLNFIDHSQ